jgi:hypothetical protein
MKALPLPRESTLTPIVHRQGHAMPKNILHHPVHPLYMHVSGTAAQQKSTIDLENEEYRLCLYDRAGATSTIPILGESSCHASCVYVLIIYSNPYSAARMTLPSLRGNSPGPLGIPTAISLWDVR